MTAPPAATARPRVSPLRRWAPLGLLLLGAGAVYASGLTRFLTLDVAAAHYDRMTAFVGEHFLLALLAYAAIYVAAVALSLPGAAVLSLIGGLCFGWMASAPVTVLAATAGAIIVFLAVRSSLGAALARCSGPFVDKLQKGFADNAFSYLLFLRLVPLFPFFAVNVVAGLSRMKTSTYAVATFAGVIPGALAFAWIGSGLGGVIERQLWLRHRCVLANGPENCPLGLSLADLVRPELLWGLAALGAIALIPAAVKLYKRRRRP